MDLEQRLPALFELDADDRLLVGCLPELVEDALTHLRAAYLQERFRAAQQRRQAHEHEHA